MKKPIFLILLLLCFMQATSISAEEVQISEADAVNIALRNFNNKEVDVYTLIVFPGDEAYPPTEWTIFVDAEPFKGWEHDCYIITVPRTSSVDVDNTNPTSTEKRKLPPSSGTYKKFKSVTSFGMNIFNKPNVTKTNLSNSEQSAAQRTYAIILSGGINMIANAERYWNDCSYIYKTLVNKYGVPHENIYPIMADGNNPAADMQLNSGLFVSQNLDLDGDGTKDIKLAATKNNIQDVLSTLAQKMQKNDHLFFYVIDHGGTIDKKSQSYICLWGKDNYLHDYELANMLEPFTNKLVNVNVVLGQCYAGGFIDDLKKVGCVVATACTGSEPSWACWDIPYDEFVYQWTNAINGVDQNRQALPTNPDTDGNGHTTMLEAFQYAYEYDRRSNECPMYASTPISIGEDLAFDNLPESVDLYLKDNNEDTGKEPNLTTDIFWDSPDIWVRHKNDTGTSHQNPEFTTSSTTVYICVRVRNRGKEDFKGNKFVHAYWADASTSISTETWKGRELYVNDEGQPKGVTGNHLESAPIPEIPAGGEAIVKISWPTPNRFLNGSDEPGYYHFCIFAKIMDTHYDDGYVEGQVYFEPQEKNDHAQKNVTIIYRKDTSRSCDIFVRNTKPTEASYSFEFIPGSLSDKAFFNNSNIQMSLSNRIYNAWGRGGFQENEINPLPYASGSYPQTLSFHSTESRLQYVLFNAKEFDKVSVKFNFSEKDNTKDRYTFHLVQRDENGKIVGGETFIVENPMFKLIPIKPDPIIGGEIQLSIEDSKYSSIRWANENGDNIGDSESIIVSPARGNRTFTVVGTMDGGEEATGSITLEPNDGIKSASATSSNIDVEFFAPAPANAEISLTSLIDGTIKSTTKVASNSTSARINTTSLASGIYVITYIVDDEIVDYSKVHLQ